MLLEELEPAQTRGDVLLPELTRYQKRVTHKVWHFFGCMLMFGEHHYFGMYLYKGTRAKGGFGYRLCARCGYTKKVAIVRPDTSA